MDFTQAIARVLDFPLGWMLALPREAAIAIVAILTSLVLTLVRKLTTNQDRMRRCKQDLARLKALAKEHKAVGDKEAARRTRATITTIKLIQLRAEWRGLVVSLVPIAALALWAAVRLDYLPVRAGERITITARYSLSAIDSVTHLVHVEGAQLESPTVQVVRADPSDREHGVAAWTIIPQTAGRLEVIIRHDRQSARHVLQIGGAYYEPPRAEHQGGLLVSTEAKLQQARFLGLVPGIAAIGFPPWLVAYLLIAIPLTPLIRYIVGVS